MDTWAGNDGDPGCNAANWNNGSSMGMSTGTSSAATFAPSALNVSQWVEVIQGTWTINCMSTP